MFLFLFVGCTSEKEPTFSAECEQNAKSLVPSSLLLSFEKAHKGINDPELPYLLEIVHWTDGSSSIQDRLFRKPTTSGKNKHWYYPIKEDSSEFSHGARIYSPLENYAYEFVLEPTDQVIYNEKEDVFSSSVVTDYTSGKRLFMVKEIHLLECY
jgi:hypothetical protein